MYINPILYPVNAPPRMAHELDPKGESMNRTEISVINGTNLASAALTKALKILGFALVMFGLIQVTHDKFAQLKNDIQNEHTTALTADQQMKELACLTKNIYWEAASEPFEGKVAVAQVTLNRVASGKFANSVCGVVYQKNVFYEKVICQFSWACETVHKTRPVYPKLWNESEEVAKRVLFEKFRLPGLTEAMYYHADYVSPGWKLSKIDQIGRHIFYK